MLLNAVEKALMNNPVRAALQRQVEARRLLAMGGRLDGAHVLEVGCGRGVGTEILLDLFGAARVDAFDLDADMVARARTRLAGRGDAVRLSTGDAEHIHAPDGTYDAVVDFAILHHVPSWRRAVREIHRVLQPGGRFFAEEVLAAAITSPLWRAFLDHPQEDRFDAGAFRAELEQAGFVVTAQRELLDQVAWWVAVKPLAA